MNHKVSSFTKYQICQCFGLGTSQNSGKYISIASKLPSVWYFIIGAKWSKIISPQWRGGMQGKLHRYFYFYALSRV